MILRESYAGSLCVVDEVLTLDLRSSSLGQLAAMLTLLPSAEELASHRGLHLDFSALPMAYPATAAIVSAWFLQHEKILDAPERTVDYTPPSRDHAERWLEDVGFVDVIVGNTGDASDRSKTMVLRQIAPGTEAASYDVSRDVDALLSRNGVSITPGSQNDLFVALAEVTENVIRHANIASPAFACAQIHPQTSKFSVCIADAGIGLAASFKNAPYAPARERINSGESPLNLAIEPLMSSKYGMGHSGYGLFYTSELCALSRGTFSLTSGTESLVIHPNGRYKTAHNHWRGTIVHILMDVGALIDGSEVWKLLPDLNEDEPRLKYLDEAPAGSFELRSLGARLLTRRAGAAARELALQAGNDELTISMHGVSVLTPSFADEFFGGIYSHFGPERCLSFVRIAEADDYVRSLIEMVIKHRAERK